jgi:ferredoxin
VIEPALHQPRVVHVDRDRCESHGKCYLVASSQFEPDDDEGKAIFVGGPIAESDADATSEAQTAIDACPERALSWATSEAIK